MNKKFNSERNGSGTKEWSEHSYNICIGCSNNCKYCFARFNAVKRYGYVKKDEDWAIEKINWDKVKKTQKKQDGVIMFPTTHDITPNNIEACLLTIEKILEAGNNILIVSKPNFQCFTDICYHCNSYKEQIMFRFTIGSMNQNVLNIFEPNAPSLYDRIASLNYAYDAGYKTSLSCEPLLGGLNDFVKIYTNLRDRITDTIWVGKMNQIESRLVTDNEEMKESKKWIKDQQTDENIMELYNTFKDIENVKWKDSIQKVILKHKGV